MALVPNGCVRRMQAQSIKDFAGGLKEIFAQMAEDPARQDVTQQNVAGGSNANQGTGTQMQPAGADGMQQSIDNVQQDALQKDQQDPVIQQPQGPNVRPDEEEQDTDGSGAAPGSFEDSVYNLLMKLGVQHREWLSKKENLFKQKKNFSTKKLEGFFLIPSYTRKHKITFDEADNLAAQLCGKFGLEGDTSTEGVWFKVTFRSQEQVGDGEHGSAFDAIPTGRAHKHEQSKAAQVYGVHTLKTVTGEECTLGEILKERRNDLYETMRKIACQMENK